MRFCIPLSLLCAACAAPIESTVDEPPPVEGAPVVVDLSELEPLMCGGKATDGERVGEACEPLICEALCLVGSYLGCAGAWAACGFGPSVTVGALTIPRTPLTAVACSLSAGGAAACIVKEC